MTFPLWDAPVDSSSINVNVVVIRTRPLSTCTTYSTYLSSPKTITVASLKYLDTIHGPPLPLQFPIVKSLVELGDIRLELKIISTAPSSEAEIENIVNLQTSILTL